MPFREVSVVSSRLAFVCAAGAEGANVRDLCRQFDISPTTGYKWLRRYRAAGAAGLVDQPRRPRACPGRTPPAVEAAVVGLRREHPAWGGRKLHAVLAARGEPAPPPSTCTEIVRRAGLLAPGEAAKHRPHRRFAAEAPNELWQLDFKDVATGPGGGPAARAYPLHVLDDASRYLLAAVACPDQLGATVQAALTRLFQEVGLPARILSDNGPPWGSRQGEARLTRLSAWWVRLGIEVVHGRPYHPETQGKVERTMRTLADEALRAGVPADLPALQAALDAWRAVYNAERPHEALGMTPPARHYAPSPRPFPARLPPVEYAAGETVRKVGRDGRISLRDAPHRVSRALAGEAVALRPTGVDGVLAVYSCHHYVRAIDLRTPPGPGA